MCKSDDIWNIVDKNLLSEESKKVVFDRQGSRKYDK